MMDSAVGRPRVIETDLEAIDALGGPTKIADMLDIRPPAVGGWKKKGRIPPRRRFWAKRELQALGYEVPDDFVERGMTD